MKKTNSATKYRLMCDYGRGYWQMRVYDDRAQALVAKASLEKSTCREWTIVEAEGKGGSGEREAWKKVKGPVAKGSR